MEMKYHFRVPGFTTATNVAVVLVHIVSSNGSVVCLIFSNLVKYYIRLLIRRLCRLFYEFAADCNGLSLYSVHDNDVLVVRVHSQGRLSLSTDGDKCATAMVNFFFGGGISNKFNIML